MIDILILHGIAKTIDADYYSPFITGIKKYLPSSCDVLFRPVDYSGLLEEKEDRIFGWMKDLPYHKITEFASYYVADAIAYAHPKRPAGPGDFIYDVTKLLMTQMANIRGGKHVVIGHSLGSIVGFGVTFDVKVDCLITMGSPFFYYSPRFKNLGEMNPNLAQFHNFWKGHDKVCTGPISKNPTFAAVHDYEVKSWNPKYLLPVRAHSIYWSSDFVHRQIAKIIQGL